ncbi:kinesin-like protein KIF20B isoform X2 [Hemicordylus capensis]|uniref:kinesin-like protein KIF20B isoform X2 n=1 Tax=Hemicordylus capensis TaxID=884348 RepID=UPI0023043B12|nr:kinesin-like protein KIF20B isoform X2 [Hemicordylus capensis]
MLHEKNSIWHTGPGITWSHKPNFNVLDVPFKQLSFSPPSSPPPLPATPLSNRMEANLDKSAFPRPSFVTAVEISPKTSPVDASDIKRNLYGDFSSTSNISQKDSLGSKEHIHVCLRIRPHMLSEEEVDSQDCISVLDSTSIILKAPKSSMVFHFSEKHLGQTVQKFTFSQVFGPETTQEEFFQGTVKQSVQDFLKGHSRLIFTYGVTNAGKTYTYQGTDEDAGVLPRALDMLFKSIQGRLYTEMDLKPHRCQDHRKLTKEEAREEVVVKNSLLRLVKEVDYQNDISGDCSKTSDHSEELGDPLKEAEQSNIDEGRGAKFSVWISFCEIYNECIYDLLLPISSDKRRKVLCLAQDIKGCSYVKDLQWIQVCNSKEAFKLMKLGLKHQSFASTKLNANSSRSHSIFTVKMLKIDPESARVKQVSELFLCDLAGSERCTRTHNEGERLKESVSINTSLHILGKCIHALKTSQQSKLQQHIPFRESKLTRFFQGFFSGKGKVCMIVNVSQSASAYDEMLNVLKFSAIAQKVVVLDASSSSQEELCDQMSIKAGSEVNTEKVLLPVKRTTMLWERTLEDVAEDEEELVAESCGVQKVNCVAEDLFGKEAEPESPSQAGDEEDNVLVIEKEDYQRLLNVIEQLKKKLIDERKEKLYMELKIRKEVTEECAQYLAEQNVDLKELFEHKQELMEDSCEERIRLYKDLVKECIPLTNGRRDAEEMHSNEQVDETREPGNTTDLVCMVGSLQQNVMDIRRGTETVFELLSAFEDPQSTIERLEKQLTEVTAELSKAEKEMSCRCEEVKIQETRLNESAKVLQDATEKIARQNKRIQELMQVVEQKDDEISRLQDLINHLETIIKDSETTIATIKQEIEHKNSTRKACCTHSCESMEQYVGTGRKRCLESEEDEEEGPPAKQGSSNSSKDAIETKNLEEMQPHNFKEKGEIVAIEEKNTLLEIELATLRGQLEKEKAENKGLSSEITSLSQKLSSSEEKASGLCREPQQQKANCEMMSELVELKDVNKQQEEKIQLLLKEMAAASQMLADKKSKIKAVEVKIGELSRLGSQCPSADIDLANGKEVVELPKERHEQVLVKPGRKSSFHCSVESICELTKQIIHQSAQKSSQIQDVYQQVEQWQKRALNAENEKCQLTVKLSETVNRVEISLQEKKHLLNQLRDLQQENALSSEKYREEENKALGYLEKIKEMDGLLEECRVKEANMACLEQALKDKESAMLVMEKELKDMQQKLDVSQSNIKKLSDQELQLKEQVLELRNNSRTIGLQEKSREQALEHLNKELLESTSLSSRLQIEIQQKDEEYADLKEKLADAKKQIDQVQKQVCTMRTEEKTLRNKVGELEKVKNQLTEELDIKQRTIQQFNKEELSKKLKDVSQQYQKACKDLSSKEKIIEDMKLTLEEQEQTQLEQDQALEAKIEECKGFVEELEEWKKGYHELEKQISSLGQQNVDAECEGGEELAREELRRLKDKLKECEEQHVINHKKWLAEKMTLLTQAKEAETCRNREMKRFAGDREQHTKQLAEAEKLVTEKENNLKKWRSERDQLVAALEVQLSSLLSSNAQKDKEIEELKKSAKKASGNGCETIEELGQSAERDYVELKQIGCENSKPIIPPMLKATEEAEGLDKQPKLKQTNSLHHNETGDTDPLLQKSSRTSLVEDLQEDQSEAILDSCEVSAGSDQTSRFPEPELEINFTPLQPNKMEVKHQGSPSAVTIKVPKARKRKSNSMDETAPDQSLRKGYPSKKKHIVHITDSPVSRGRTLKKVGFFLRSPTIIHSKAKELLTAMKSPKPTEEESVKENDHNPKQAKHKLYSTDISSPVEFSGHMTAPDQSLKRDYSLRTKKVMTTVKSSTEEESIKENYRKPKQAKRKLYSTDISSPIEFSGHVIIMDQKENDHEIIKRRLRPKKAH